MSTYHAAPAQQSCIFITHEVDAFSSARMTLYQQ